ncbi:MAG: LPS assembly lipoprotein LptE [Fluviibacter sp.]
MMRLPNLATLNRLLLSVLMLAIVVGCGFKLRGAISVNLPFKTVYVSGVPDTSPFAQVLKAQLRANGIGVVPDEYKDRAEVILRVLGDQQMKTVLAVNPSGLAREYRLSYRLGFKVESGSGIELYPPTTIDLTRDISFNPQTAQEVLSKEQEDAMLIRDMQNDAAIQVMQRLSTIRVPPGTVLTAPRKKDTISATQGKQPAKAAAPEVLTTPTGMQPLGGVAQ